MTPSYTSRPMPGGHGIVKIGEPFDILEGPIKTKFKTELRLRDLNVAARQAQYIGRVEAKTLTDDEKDKILAESKKVRRGSKIKFWTAKAEEYNKHPEYLQLIIREHRRERGL